MNLFFFVIFCYFSTCLSRLLPIFCHFEYNAESFFVIFRHFLCCVRAPAPAPAPGMWRAPLTLTLRYKCDAYVDMLMRCRRTTPNRAGMGCRRTSVTESSTEVIGTVCVFSPVWALAGVLCSIVSICLVGLSAWYNPVCALSVCLVCFFMCIISCLW